MSSSAGSRGLSVVATATTFNVLAFGFVATRLYARVRILKNPGRDEVAIVLSLFFDLIFLVFIFLQVKYGLGRHFDTLSPNDLVKSLQYLWASIPFYNASLFLTKISIVLQYLRVFVGPRIRLTCWIVMGIVSACATFSILGGILTCIPVAKFWDPTLNGSCLPHKFLWFFNASLNIMTDLLILIVPMPVIRELKLPRNQKIGLMAIFALGGFVCLVSIIRLHSLYVVSDSTDITFDNADASMWSAIECNVGIICASLPTIKPVISLLFPRMLSSNRSTGPTLPSYSNQNTFQSRNDFRQTHIPLYDVAASPKVATKVEASNVGKVDSKEREITEHSGNGNHTSKQKHISQQIVVTSTVMQDIESKSDSGSEKDLITQK